MTRKENKDHAEETNRKTTWETQEVPKDPDGGPAEDRHPEKREPQNSSDRHGNECCRYHS